MRTTFLNCSDSDRKNFRNKAKQHCLNRAEDFIFWMDNGTDLESTSLNTDSEENRKEAEKAYAEHGNFFDYGLSVDYVAPGTFKNRRGYLRYQLSWGGPSEEVRFYCDADQREADKIEFVYMDWGTGCGLDVTHEAWAEWLYDWFNDCGTIQAERNKALSEA